MSIQKRVHQREPLQDTFRGTKQSSSGSKKVHKTKISRFGTNCLERRNLTESKP